MDTTFLLDKQKTDFPTQVHCGIHKAALELTPPDTSLGGCPGMDEGLAASCRQYYRFVLAMLSSMYQDPHSWGLNAGELEAFLGGKTVNAIKRHSPSKITTLLTKTGGGLTGYQNFFYALGRQSTPTPEGMTLEMEDYQKVRQTFDGSLNTKSKSINNDIPYSTRLSALEGLGLTITEAGEKINVVSQRFPGMFEAWSALARSVETVKTFGMLGFSNCEFRQIHSPYTPTYEDVIQPLDENKREIINAVHQYAKSLKLRPSITTYWKINYHIKNRHVLCIDVGGNSCRVRVDGGQREWYLDQIAAQGEDFKKYFLRHLNYCTACSTSHIGMHTEVFGHKKRLCQYGTPAFRVTNPTGVDMDFIKKFINFRHEDILLHKEG